jgi:hypothetical protein
MGMESINESSVKKIKMAKARICVSHAHDPRAINLFKRADLYEYRSSINNMLISSLDTYILGMPDENIEVHKSWPKDWWQAFKQRWFPDWAIRRWPVEMSRIDVCERRYKAVCPHIEAPSDRNVCLAWMYEQTKENT